MTAIPNLVWGYVSWRHKLGLGALYIWPWVLISTLVYGVRAYRLNLYTWGLGKVGYDLRSIRVAIVPFLAAFFLPFLNFLFNPRVPITCTAISLVVSGICWVLFDISTILIGPGWQRP